MMDSKSLAKEIRKEALTLTTKNRAGHIGSMLSIADIVAVLFSGGMNISGSRDRLVISKGHAALIVVAALYKKKIVPRSELENYWQNKKTNKARFVRGIDFMSCSLGHGICVGVGMALAAKIDNQSQRVFVIVGNGECNEGTVWEAMMAASHYKLDNLVIIVDDNKMQALGESKDCLDMGSIEDKFRVFGAEVVCIDGHCHEQIYKAMQIHLSGKPLVIIANTIKGKGVSFMENNPAYHYNYASPEQLKIALDEVDGQ